MSGAVLFMPGRIVPFFRRCRAGGAGGAGPWAGKASPPNEPLVAYAWQEIDAGLPHS